MYCPVPFGKLQALQLRYKTYLISNQTKILKKQSNMLFQQKYTTKGGKKPNTNSTTKCTKKQNKPKNEIDLGDTSVLWLKA